MKAKFIVSCFILLSFLSVISIKTHIKSDDISSLSNHLDLFTKFYCPGPESFGEFVGTPKHNDELNDINNSSSNWYQQVINNLNSDEYNITYDSESNSYQSPNRSNNMRFTYSNEGFSAATRNTKIPLFDINDKTLTEEKKQCKSIPSWEINMKLNSYFKDRDNAGKFYGNEFIVDKNTASIQDDNMSINYYNSKDGMRQDFIIKNKPKGNDKLRLELKAETKLRMALSSSGIIFKDKNGLEQLKYSGLKVWDANGKMLEANFEESDKSQVTCLAGRQANYKFQIRNQKSKIQNLKSFDIVVNDENATYPITIDPLSSSPNWSYEGGQVSAQSGISVATAGDVNGDGYSDVIVGANFFDNGQTNEGKVFVFHGSATGLSSSPNWSAESNQANADFGISVSTAGDVNGDGYSDIIVGSARYDSGQTNEGRVFAYYGSSTGLSVNYDWYAESNQATSLFGSSISTAGDVNGDGYSDVIIGCHMFDNGQSNEGKVFVYHGSSSGLESAESWTSEMNQANAFYGFSVSLAGDVNRDGYSDVIVGAYQFDNGQSDEGKAFVFLGTSAGLSFTSNWDGEPDQSFANYGYSVAGAGDVNGDGYSDIIVGAIKLDSGQTDEGKAFVYYGSSTGPSLTPNWTGESNQATANYGISVATAGDVNGDGYCDVIIGANLLDSGQTDEGKAFVYNGSSTGLAPIPEWTGESNQAGASYGSCVATAGDVNGDGFSDVIVGAYLYENGETDEGKTFVYYGSASKLSQIENWSAESNQANSLFGWSVSTAGDVNGDGYGDVIVGAKDYNNGQSLEGRAYVYLGSSNGLSITPNWMAEPNIGSYFGQSVSTAGDVNGDGYSDVIVGAPWLDSGQTDEGRAYVYFGSASGLSLTPNWTAEGNQANGHFGWSVSTAGDVNGDGYSDVVIGADDFDNGQSDEGKVFVYYGSSTGLSLVANWTAESNQASSQFGYSVSTAGDVNGDGFSDVIIGARYYDNMQTDEGRAYVYLGSTNGLQATESWTAEPNLSSSDFGTSVSTAGDINGDGYSDVIIGSPYLNNGQSDEGRVYVYNGSASGLSNTAGWTVESNQTSALYGNSVSTAGDVNGDGYSDVIIGSREYDNGQSNEGRAYLYLGSSTGLSIIENWLNESNQASARYGQSVSTAGDVNGDGFSDVVVGAYLFDNGQTDEGRAFVYYGNGAGGKSLLQQTKPSNGNVVTAGGLTGTDAQVKLNIFGRSPFGRSQGKMIYEYKTNGTSFSGNPITNSVGGTAAGTFSDLLLTGKNLSADLTGLSLIREYKWRARVQYKLSSNPYQKFGPWKYYNNYSPVPFAGFVAREYPVIYKTIDLTVFIEGLYNAGTNSMIQDTVQVLLKNSSFDVVDSSKVFLNTAGRGILTSVFSPATVPYYLVIKHRNSMETWSSSANLFVNSLMVYDFTTSVNKAFGNNMIQVDNSPVKFAVYTGDVNQDSVIDLTDVIAVYNDGINFLSGYSITDLTGDGTVDLTDQLLAYNNSNNFVVLKRPY